MYVREIINNNNIKKGKLIIIIIKNFNIFINASLIIYLLRISSKYFYTRQLRINKIIRIIKIL